MGGLGSGRWAYQNRDTVESHRTLDVNRLNRAGYLKSGRAGTWQWTQDSKRVASIGLRARDDRLILSHRHQVNGGEWQEVEEPIPLV